MKIPAIRSEMGDWTYYVTTLTFDQVNQYVSRIDDELHSSNTLKELIQRSITSNYISIKEYILNQSELFFNALVLAVYDDYPEWREIEFKYEDVETFSMGLLEFPGTHKIFPVDGQHRVEGIRAALLEQPELGTQKITAIFIGHKNDAKGMQRTRRLFSTLNRYAKPVSLRDIIALDEDDSVAINTRYLVEDFPLFKGDNTIDVKGKAVPVTNRKAITSIITLYQCNNELMKYYYAIVKGEKATKKKLDNYLKFRPQEEEIKEFRGFIINFWENFGECFSDISVYLSTESDKKALPFRNKKGGNLLFRPKGLLPFVKACIEIKNRTDTEFKEIFLRLAQYSFILTDKPWTSILWNSIEKKMIMNSDTVVYLLFIYLFDETLLKDSEVNKLQQGYGAKIGLSEDEIENALDGIK